MSLELRIVRGFLDAHPQEAARVIERMPESAVAAVLEEAEPSEIATVLGAVVPSLASKHLDRLDPERAGMVLAQLPSERAADFLRRLDSDRRTALLAQTPEDPRAPIERLLRFPPDTAGALMEPNFVAFHVSRRAGDVLAELKEQGTELRFYLYVVDDDLVVAGVLSVRELVASDPGSPLSEIMRRPVQTLSARAGRGAILGHPGWKRFPTLPVADEAGRIVGVFRYRTFQDLKGAPEEQGEPGALGLALALGELFWWGAAGLFRGLERMGDGGDGR